MLCWFLGLDHLWKVQPPPAWALLLLLLLLLLQWEPLRRLSDMQRPGHGRLISSCSFNGIKGAGYLDISNISNILDNVQLWLLLSKFRKRKLLYYHLFGRLSVAHGFHIFPFPLFLQFLLYSSPPPQRKIFFSSKYFHLPFLLMDNEYDRISVEIVDTLDSGWGNMPLKYVFFCCFFALISFYLPINMFNLFCWWCNNHNISCSL